jgi:hypothetical protein
MKRVPDDLDTAIIDLLNQQFEYGYLAAIDDGGALKPSLMSTNQEDAKRAARGHNDALRALIVKWLTRRFATERGAKVPDLRMPLRRRRD